MRQQHQDRQRQQDLLFQIGSTAASQGLPLGDELAGAYKKLGGSQDVWGALTGLAKQKQQAAQQADQQSMAMLGLKPEDVGMGGPAAGAASAGGGALPPSSGPAGQGAPAGGPQDMGDAGPNAGKHWGDQAFDWQHYMANEPPQIKDIDRQMRVTMFRLDSASRRGQPTQGLKAQLDDLKGQHEELLKSYLGYGATQEKQGFELDKQQRGEAFQQGQQARGFAQQDHLKQLESDLKSGSPSEQTATANEAYTELASEKEDIAAGLKNGTLTKAQATAKLAAVRAKAVKLDQSEAKAKRKGQAEGMGLLSSRVEDIPNKGLLGKGGVLGTGYGSSSTTPTVTNTPRTGQPPVAGAVHGISKTKVRDGGRLTASSFPTRKK